MSSIANFLSDAATKGVKIEMELLQTAHIQAKAKLAKILSVPIGT